jgi:hypothetical protein
VNSQRSEAPVAAERHDVGRTALIRNGTVNKPGIDDQSNHPVEKGAGGSIVTTLRAVLLAFAILYVGGVVSGAVMFANLKLAPALPLFLPGTVLWLWLFWRYVRGDGWPRSFFLAHGLTMGLLVFYTRSITPGIVLHAVSDFIVLPMQYGVIPSAGESAFVWQGWLLLLAGTAAVPAFRQLARTLALQRVDMVR